MASVGSGITVIYANGEIEEVQRYMLDHLIRGNMIVAFQRVSGWVDAGGYTIRKTPSDYGWSDEFPERRES
jgi:hypothetical protein